MTVDAVRIDVTLDGPKMKATGDVRSTIQPAKKDQAATDQKAATKMPSMLKGDQPVSVIGDALDYDGSVSKATYTGKAKLWQADTSINAQTLTIDNKEGDLTASGSVATSAMLEQGTKNAKAKERVRTMGTASDFVYEESMRRATYTKDAHLTGPQGDMTAAKIELYLQPSGDAVDRVEALREADAAGAEPQNDRDTNDLHRRQRYLSGDGNAGRRRRRMRSRNHRPSIDLRKSDRYDQRGRKRRNPNADQGWQVSVANIPALPRESSDLPNPAMKSSIGNCSLQMPDGNPSH